MHLGNQRVRRCRTAFLVDVEAVRLDADGENIRAELPKGLRRNLVGGTMGAIDNHAQTVELHVPRQRALGVFDIARMGGVDAFGAAQRLRLGKILGQIRRNQRLDLLFRFIGELVAIGPEQLDAIILKRIVRRRDHHTKISTHRTGQHRDGGRRHRPEQEHIHADGRKPGDQRVFDHVA